LGGTGGAGSALALTGTQKSLIKLLNSNPVTTDLRSVSDVIVLLRRKVTDNPQDGNLRLRLGTYLYLAGDLSGSATEMKRAVSINPEDYLAHIILARVLDLSGEEAAAELSSNGLCRLSPMLQKPIFITAKVYIVAAKSRKPWTNTGRLPS